MKTGRPVQRKLVGGFLFELDLKSRKADSVGSYTWQMQRKERAMAKNIIFCADGTWNSPGQDEDNDHNPDPTNVYKLFMMLDGTFTDGSITLGDEQEKELIVSGVTTQVAKYIHGVGDSKNPIIKLMGGAFGAGVISRIVRGYTYISRMYEPGDLIHIVGFSRGAYTARALAGLITSQGLLQKALAQDKDKDKVYQRGAQAWYQYRGKHPLKNSDYAATFAEVIGNLPGFLTRDELKPTDFIADSKIKSVAVWDTVGAIGIPEIHQDKRFDPFRFADTKLNNSVEWGFHAISLDEQRIDFTPTLWEDRKQMRQLVFPGAHADVGGGYPIAESGLSDIALGWMFNELDSVGVKFKSVSMNLEKFDAVAHMPWRESLYLHNPRKDLNALTGHHSIAKRMESGLVKPDPKEEAVQYDPPNRPATICTNRSYCSKCVLSN